MAVVDLFGGKKAPKGKRIKKMAIVSLGDINLPIPENYNLEQAVARYNNLERAIPGLRLMAQI